MSLLEIGPGDDENRLALATGRHDEWTHSSPRYQSPGGTGIGVQDVLRVMRRNVWLIIATTAIVAGAVAFFVSREIPQYRAAASFRWIDPKRELAGGILGGSGGGADPILSQIEVLRGRNVVGEVVDREGLRIVGVSRGAERVLLEDVRIDSADASDTLFVEFGATELSVRSSTGARAQAPYGLPVQLPGIGFTVQSRPEIAEATLAVIPRDAAIDRTIPVLTARPRANTDAVDVQFTAPQRVAAQRVVNAAVDAFRDASATAAQTQSRRRRIFLEKQLVSVDSSFAALQAQLSDFRSRTQVYSATTKIDARQTGLIDLDVRREDLVADRQLLTTLLGQLQRAGTDREALSRVLSASPAVAGNSTLAALQAELAGYVKAREDRTTGALAVTAQHPDVQRIDIAIRAMPAKLVDAVRNQISAADARVVALDDLRSRYSGEIAQLSGTEADEGRLVQEMETARSMSDQLRAELQRTRIAEAVEAGGVEIINYAPIPTQPLTSGGTWKIGLGLAMGLLLGSGLAFFRESLNTSIRRRDEMEEALQVPGLAVIPRIGVVRGIRKRSPRRVLPAAGSNGNGAGHVRPGHAELVMLSDLHSSSAEAFRVLRTNLLFAQPTSAIKTVVVTSATPGEGKTTTAANLAVTFAQQGLRVLLVDCDLRRARLHRMFGYPLAPGLSELVGGDVPATGTIHPTDVDGLSVLTAGTLPPNPAELLGGRRMKRVLELLPEGFDLVILDTPPVMAAADAAILGARADGVLLVVRAGQTERGAAQFAMQQLHGVGARVLGAVLNDPDSQVQRYGGYYAYDYYGVEQPV